MAFPAYTTRSSTASAKSAKVSTPSAARMRRTQSRRPVGARRRRVRDETRERSRSARATVEGCAADDPISFYKVDPLSLERRRDYLTARGDAWRARVLLNLAAGITPVPDVAMTTETTMPATISNESAP